MTIPLDLAARIERLYTVEHWRVGTIARQLHVHRDTVRRVLREHQAVLPGVALRRSLIDPYRAFIDETLQKYPTLAASRAIRRCSPPPARYSASLPRSTATRPCADACTTTPRRIYC